ncbi:MAG TPA: hypothetical protein VMF61_03435 [Candidatus Acidoferrales bacterium]|nr:hypothetical protein [Candidatus Acidoferrales bacterium]
MRSMRRSLVELSLGAAAFAAALAHYAIDVVGDFALAHDTYDDVAHGSREIVTGIAIAIAAIVALRGLRTCCEFTAERRWRRSLPGLSWRALPLFVASAAAGATAIVPLMELTDARCAGIRLDDVGDAFGGSLLLGAGVTVACAIAVACICFSLARWIVSRRDRIVTLVVSLVARTVAVVPSAQHVARYFTSPRRRRATCALRLSKRGPPGVAVFPGNTSSHELQGDPCATLHFPRRASFARVRVDRRLAVRA